MGVVFIVQIALKNYDNENFKFLKMPTLLYAGQISNEPEWKFSSHRHDELCELIYISEGDGDYIIDNKYYRAKKGDILVYNKGVLHDEKSDPANPLKTYFCGIGNLLIEGMKDGCLVPSEIGPVIHTGKYMFKVENYISDIFEECYSQILGYDILCNHLLISLIILIIRVLNIQDNEPVLPGTNSLGYQIKKYIDKNYTEDISLNKIANRLYVSQDYLSHVFKQETGFSPINYLISRRIGEAKKLLLSKNLSIQEISELVGYNNANYFTMLFKKVTGTTPKKFKEINSK